MAKSKAVAVSKKTLHHKVHAMGGALKKARHAVNSQAVKGPMDAGLMVGTSIVAGVTSSMALGYIPVPASAAKFAPAGKSLIQLVGGLVLMIVTKNKFAKAAGAGMATLGGADLVKRISPVHLPAMAGEADEMVYGDRDDRNLSQAELDQIRRLAGEPIGEPIGGEPIGSSGNPFGSGKMRSPY